MKLRQSMRHRYSLICKRPSIVSYRPKYNLQRILWEINPYDSDENENWSVPHGDDIYPTHHTLKLNVYTGEIIRLNNRSTYGWLSKKELSRLHNDERYKRAVDIAIKNHNSQQKSNKTLNENFVFESSYIVFKTTRKWRKQNVKNSRHH